MQRYGLPVDGKASMCKSLQSGHRGGTQTPITLFPIWTNIKFTTLHIIHPEQLVSWYHPSTCIKKHEIEWQTPSHQIETPRNTPSKARPIP
jgi:hypothetical protein